MQENDEILRALGKDPKRAEENLERLLSEPPNQAREAVRAELCRMEIFLKQLTEALQAFAERLPKRKSLFEESDGNRFYTVVGSETVKIDQILTEARKTCREEISQAVRDTRQELLKRRYFCEVVSREFPTLSSKARQGIEKTREQEETLEELSFRLEAIQAQYAVLLLDHATPFLKQVGRLADVRHRGERMQSGAIRAACESLFAKVEPLLAAVLKMKAESEPKK